MEANFAFAAFAFLAGAVSFLSPCVLPLVPGYLSYISGGAVDQAGEQPNVRRVVVPTLLFVLGFTTIFVALGTSASYIGQVLRANQQITVRVAGAFIILMGLVFMGLIPAPWLMSERRFDMRKARSVAGNYAMGLAFGFGWTPCIGPTLAVALTLAANTQTAGKGALMLLIYSLGLGIPFLLSAIGASKLIGGLAWLRRKQRAILRVSGSLLIAFGLLMVFGKVFILSAWIQQAMESAGLDKLVGI